MIFFILFLLQSRTADLVRRTAAILLRRLAVDGIVQPAALPAAFPPDYRDATADLRHPGIQQPALTDSANRLVAVV